MKRRGFTLIELLVVVAIIGMLIGIVVPALSSARARGQSTKCLGHLHDIGTALAGYLQQNGDRFPLSQAHGGYQPGTAWLDTLMPHTSSKAVYRCPSDESTNFDVSDAAQRRVTSYGVNSFMGPDDSDEHADDEDGDEHEDHGPGHPPFGYVVATRIANTSTKVFVCELAEQDGRGRPVFADHVHPEAWGVNPFTGYGGTDPRHDVALDRHRGQANYVYADSHAASVGFDQTFLIASDGRKLVDQWDPGFPHSPEGWYRPGSD